MTLDTSYPQPEGLCVDHAQRFSDSPADQALASRYSRLSVLLAASLALHLSILTVLDLSGTAPPVSKAPRAISVELVSEPQPAAPKSAAAPQKKTEAKPAETAKPDTKSAIEQPTAPEPKKDQPAKSEAAKQVAPQIEAPKQQAAEPKSEEPPQKTSVQKPVPAATKPAAAPAPTASNIAPKPQPADVKPRPADSKPATPPPPPQSLPWEQAPSQASQPPQSSGLGTGTGLPLEEQEAVPVQMPTADGDIAMSYETVVSGKLALARRYPPEADARGAHGAAMIAFLIDDKGHVVKLKLLKSSGDAALDVESLALVMRAEPFPPPPPGAEREFSIKVDFERGK